jgi:hypothetical protein
MIEGSGAGSESEPCTKRTDPDPQHWLLFKSRVIFEKISTFPGTFYENDKGSAFDPNKGTVTSKKKVFDTLQGGSDKSGILIWFFKNDTAHLKTIRFH